MEIKEYLDIAELEGQIVEGTWSGYVLTLKNGNVYKLDDDIRGWIKGTFYVKDRKPEEIPDWNVSRSFEEHFEEVLQDVLKELGLIDENENGCISCTIFRYIKRRWYNKWKNAKENE